MSDTLKITLVIVAVVVGLPILASMCGGGGDKVDETLKPGGEVSDTTTAMAKPPEPKPEPEPEPPKFPAPAITADRMAGTMWKVADNKDLTTMEFRSDGNCVKTNSKAGTAETYTWSPAPPNKVSIYMNMDNGRVSEVQYVIEATDTTYLTTAHKRVWQRIQ